MTKAEREKLQKEKFNRKCSSIFSGMKRRARELGREAEIDFDLASLRRRFEMVFHGYSCSCGRPLTVKNFSADHAIPIKRGGSFSGFNIGCLCKTCNSAKCGLTGQEYGALLRFLDSYDGPIRKDFIARLAQGAKGRQR